MNNTLSLLAQCVPWFLMFLSITISLRTEMDAPLQEDNASAPEDPRGTEPQAPGDAPQAPTEKVPGADPEPDDAPMPDEHDDDDWLLGGLGGVCCDREWK